jgi:hypothetical protein
MLDVDSIRDSSNQWARNFCCILPNGTFDAITSRSKLQLTSWRGTIIGTLTTKTLYTVRIPHPKSPHYRANVHRHCSTIQVHS